VSLIPVAIPSFLPGSLKISPQKNRPPGPVAQALWKQIQDWSKEVEDFEKQLAPLLIFVCPPLLSKKVIVIP